METPETASGTRVATTIGTADAGVAAAGHPATDARPSTSAIAENEGSC